MPQKHKLVEKYNKEVIPAMIEKFGYKSPMAVPKIEKVVVNIGFGKIITGMSGEEQRKAFREAVFRDLSLICGQAPVFCKAKKSISSFKLRKGMIIGAKVTLRGKRMYDFIERLINIALPRSRDFRGIEPTSVDSSGNLTIAVPEHIAFPEVSTENIKHIFGFEVTVVTTAENREEGLELLKLMGFPMKNI